MIFVIIR